MQSLLVLLLTAWWQRVQFCTYRSFLPWDWASCAPLISANVSWVAHWIHDLNFARILCFQLIKLIKVVENFSNLMPQWSKHSLKSTALKHLLLPCRIHSVNGCSPSKWGIVWCGAVVLRTCFQLEITDLKVVRLVTVRFLCLCLWLIKKNQGIPHKTILELSYFQRFLRQPFLVKMHKLPYRQSYFLMNFFILQ